MEKNVLETIVESKRLPVLFVGSGISKRYLYNYPTWGELLELSFKKYNSDIFQLQKHKDSFRRQNLSDFEIQISNIKSHSSFDSLLLSHGVLLNK